MRRSKKMYSIGIISLGCPKNTVDSEAILADLGAAGYIITSSLEEAEIIIINTCGFIRPAVEEAIKTIMECLQYKYTGQCKCLVVTGCFPQRYGKRLARLMPEVDLWMGVDAPLRIQGALKKALKGEKLVDISPIEDYCLSDNLPRLVITPQPSAYLKIAEGCSHSCAFCIIPQLRGPLHSRPLESLIEEAKSLADMGYKELVIVAQDTGAYGRDIYGKPLLHLLLKDLAKVSGIEWIRILYLHPASLSTEVIQTIAEEPKVCHYLDLPFQHASSNILKKMGRGGSAQKYLELIERLRAAIPGLTLRTTLIAGFPSESEDDFQKLLDFVKKASFDRLGVFPYYPERGTKAFELPGRVPYLLKQKRLRELQQLQKDISRNNNLKLLGQELTVIIERKLGENVYLGRSYREAPEIDPKIIVTGENLQVGNFVRVKVTKTRDYDLIAKHQFPVLS